MKSISINEAREMILKNGKVISAESLSWNHYLSDYCDWLEAFESYNCVLLKHTYHSDSGEEKTSWKIYMTDEYSDIISLIKNTPEFKSANDLLACIIGEFPVKIEKKRHYGWMKYSGFGKLYNDDSIREINENDRNIVESLCIIREDDSRFGHIECETLTETFNKKFEHDESFKNHTILGIFENDLPVGMVTAKLHEQIDLAQVCDLFVGKEYRQKGYGKRLIKAAMSLYPNNEYLYQAACFNTESNASAKSCGLKFAGHDLWDFQDIIDSL